MAGWWAARRERATRSDIPSLPPGSGFGITGDHTPLLLQHVSALFKKDNFEEGDNSFSMHIQSLASLLRLPARMPISAIQKSPDMLW